MDSYWLSKNEADWLGGGIGGMPAAACRTAGPGTQAQGSSFAVPREN